MTKLKVPEYKEYEQEWEKALTDPHKMRIANTWFDTGTLDAWRHARMRAPLLPLVKTDPEANWLTIGDGRFGTDGNFLLRSGAKNVHCSDISDLLLKVGYERKFITAFSAENAEHLSFADESFDYLYCKESFHHFTRPYSALYEMWRVARKGVVLTEPRDTSIDKEPLELLKDLAKTLLGKKVRSSHAFEPIGNYIYSISEKELEKAALGLGGTTLATIGCNDAYQEGIEFVQMQSNAPQDVAARSTILSEVKRLDLLCKLRIKKSTLLSVVLFKNSPNQALTSAMLGAGWAIQQLPKNPYT
jgi:ubiquinone/menaquinone biosynthesis C-methylase UbiE